MEAEAIALVYEQLAGTESLPIKLDRGDGLDRRALAEVRCALSFLIKHFKGRTQVPKLLAAAFVGFQTAMTWGLDRYPRTEQIAIEDAAIELMELANQLFEAPPLVEFPSNASAAIVEARSLFQFVPRRLVSALPSDATVHDVSSRSSSIALRKLSPFYPHGRIPVPGASDMYSDSVEGIWQGLKVIGGDTDFSYFSGKGRKRRGRPEGHRFGDRLLGYVEARRMIYIPSYRYLWNECIGRDLRRFFFENATRGVVQYFYDFENIGDVEDTSSPLAHSSVLVQLLAEEYVHWLKKGDTD